MIDGQDLGYFRFVWGIMVTILIMDLAKISSQIKFFIPSLNFTDYNESIKYSLFNLPYFTVCILFNFYFILL